MEQVTYHLIEKEQDIGQRLDNYLIKTLKGVPKSRIYRIIRAGEVRVNKKRAKPDTRLQAQDMVRIPPIRVSETNQDVKQVPTHLKKQLLDAIIYEDDALMVINKPSGIAVHGGSGLSWGVIEAYRQIKSELSYLELVHRLDKDTSGCLLLAKKSSLLKKLQVQWQANQVQKMYWAICENPWVGKQQTTVTARLQKNILKSGERMVSVSPNGKEAISHVHLVKNGQDDCWVKVFIDTGRTHQIRVHCAYLGHSVLGDEKYGKTPIHQKMPRLFLHAYQLKFEYLGKMQTFVAPVDELFQNKINAFD
jgi:23S rRNA pseudouridine955/2504/2580 synthase